MTRLVVLLTGFSDGALARLRKAFVGVADVQVVSHREELLRIAFGPDVLLVSFGTAIIVPREILERLGRPAYNVHAASPSFPGRDPHHHAIYHGAQDYGATLHVMSAEVDAGPIVAVETFPVPYGATPRTLLDGANEAGLRLIERLSGRLLDPEPMPTVPGVAWGPAKTTRSDLLNFCRINPLIDEAEFQRRFKAFDAGDYDNMTLELHGHLFRIEKRASLKAYAGGTVDFTEAGFAEVLRQLKASGYRFARYGHPPDEPHVLWRHDVDLSIHRAAALAEMEVKEGAIATYFINPHSSFYNLLEPSVTARARQIAALGHEIGLHFDAAAYKTTIWQGEALEQAIDRERRLLETILETRIHSISWHNPDISNLLEFDAEVLAGLQNAYSRRLRDQYVYGSDSNGYWRFKPISALVAEGHPRLHLLTHPGWWVDKPMSPSERIDRAILGRARNVRREYDLGLERGGRQNITQHPGRDFS